MEELIEKQYKLAIDARDKLNDNYHKWMSYYYLANAGVLVAITSIYSKDKPNPGILILSTIGIFICILWHFSCKGYYYWSKSWIDIIILFEKEMKLKNSKAGVYSIFSKEVAELEDKFWLPTKSANISTPKLTLLFSFFSIICWAIFSVYQFHIQYPKFSYFTVILGFLIALTAIIMCLPFFVKSRIEDSHTLVECRKKSA